MHPSDRPVLGEPALARVQVDPPSAVTALRPGDPLEDRRADPGPETVHPFIIGAVLVISAVEGVQPQTRVLMRALLRLRIPVLLFVNKIDRAGAGEERVLRAIAARLSPAVVPMGSASGLGTRAAGLTPWGDAGR